MPKPLSLHSVKKMFVALMAAASAQFVSAQTICNLDVDGDGRYLATTDAVILTRLALGMRGASVVDGALGSNSTRRTYEEIRSYLEVQCQFATTQVASTSLSAYPVQLEASPGDGARIVLQYFFAPAIPDSARLRVIGADAYAPVVTRLPNGVWSVVLTTPSNLPIGSTALQVQVQLYTDSSLTAVIENSYAQTNVSLNISRRDWAGFSGTTTQTGYVPMSFSSVNFTRLWYWPSDLETLNEPLTLTTVSSLNGAVAVTATGRFQPQSVIVLEEQNGALRWRTSVQGNSAGNGQLHGVFAPTISGSTVFAASSGHSDTALHAFNLQTGQLRWRAPFYTQWPQLLAPTAFGGRVFVGGSDEGPIVAFDALVGTKLWSGGSTTGYDRHAVAVNGDTAYSFTGGDISVLSAVDVSTGATRFSINEPQSSWSGYSMDGAPIVGSGSQIFARTYSPGHIVAFDTSNRSVAWRSAPGFVGQPAYRQGVVYGQNSSTGQLVALDAASGSTLWTWAAPGSFQTCANVIVTDTHAFVSTSAGTHAVNLTTRQSEWSAPEFGSIALTGGRTLLVRTNCSSGASTLHGYRVLAP